MPTLASGIQYYFESAIKKDTEVRNKLLFTDVRIAHLENTNHKLKAVLELQ